MGLLLGLGLREARRETAFLPLATGFHELDAFATFEDAALGAHGTTGCFEAAMLRHNLCWKEVWKKGAENRLDPRKRKGFVDSEKNAALAWILVWMGFANY